MQNNIINEVEDANKENDIAKSFEQCYLSPQGLPQSPQGLPQSPQGQQELKLVHIPTSASPEYVSIDMDVLLEQSYSSPKDNQISQEQPEFVCIPLPASPEFFTESIIVDNEGFTDFYSNVHNQDSGSESGGERQKWNFNDMYIRSNSPIASNCNSDIETDIQDVFVEDDILLSTTKSSYVNMDTNGSFYRIENDSIDFNEHDSNNNHYRRHRHRHHRNNNTVTSIENGEVSNKKYKKFTYEDIERSLSQYYYKNEKNFTDMDLFITYLCGMRSIYNIAKNMNEMKSYTISISTIYLTICLAIIAPLIKNLYWGVYLISAGNALATILIFISKYLKLDHNSAQYAFIAKQFHKLQLRIEYASLIEKTTPTMVHEFESNMAEMHEYIQELIPYEAVALFPIIYRTNIMQFIKKIKLYRKNLIIRFRDIKNEIHYILYKWNSIGEKVDKLDSKYKSKTPQQEREKNRILYLMDLKEKTKKELMQFKNIYIQIDELFKKEIHYAETHQSCFGCSILFKPDYDFNKLNPIVRDYLKLVTLD